MNPLIMRDPDHFMIWHILLYSAVYAPQKDYFGGKAIILQPGQLITGRKALSEFTGISESKIQRILKLFEDEQQIEQRTSSRNRLITILNWEKYQTGERQIEQQNQTRDEVFFKKSEVRNEKSQKNEQVFEQRETAPYNDFHGKREQQSEQRVNSKRTTDEQQVNTIIRNKEIYKERNKEKKGGRAAGFLDGIYSEATKKFLEGGEEA